MNWLAFWATIWQRAKVEFFDNRKDYGGPPGSGGVSERTEGFTKIRILDDLLSGQDNNTGGFGELLNRVLHEFVHEATPKGPVSEGVTERVTEIILGRDTEHYPQEQEIIEKAEGEIGAPVLEDGKINPEVIRRAREFMKNAKK